MLELIYANRVGELAEDARLNPVRPEGNLFGTILPLAGRIADDLRLDAPITRSLAR